MRSSFQAIEQWRKVDGVMATREGDPAGVFYVPFGRVQLIIIASGGDSMVPWEHVSVRAEGYKGGRTPIWEEMCYVKQLFWADDECVMQLHPPRSDYVNNHPHVLHLWRPLGAEIPRPPTISV
jgi:hypothetical protein